MALSDAYDGQDKNINIPDDQPNKRDDPKQISAIRIGNGAEGCLIPVMITSHDHEAKVDDRTTNEYGDGLMERQRSNHLKNGKTVVERNPVRGDPLHYEQPKPRWHSHFR